MADNEQPQVAAPAPAPARSRKPLIISVVLVLLLGLGGGYYWKTKVAAQDSAETPAVEVSKAELYLPLDPPFVVNFRDAESLRYLQVAVTLMSHDAEAIEVAKSADPVIRDSLVSLFSNQDFEIIGDAAGRQKLQEQALEEVRKIVQARLGRPGIDALYFTSFVMQ